MSHFCRSWKQALIKNIDQTFTARKHVAERARACLLKLRHLQSHLQQFYQDLVGHTTPPPPPPPMAHSRSVVFNLVTSLLLTVSLQPPAPYVVDQQQAVLR